MTWLKTGNAYKSQRGVFRFWGHQRWNFRKSKIFPTIGIFFWPNCATRYFFLKLGRVFQFPLKSYGHISHNYFFRFIRKKRRDFSENLRLINNNLKWNLTWNHSPKMVIWRMQRLRRQNIDVPRRIQHESINWKSLLRTRFSKDIVFSPTQYVFVDLLKRNLQFVPKGTPLTLRHQELVSLRFFTTGLFYITIA